MASLIVALGALAVLAAVVTPGAQAVIKRLPNGTVISYMPLRTTGMRTYDEVFGNVDYGGGPVMPSSKNYLLFWDPASASPYPAGYVSGIDRYFTDLAHDSGGNQNTDSVATQYNDTAEQFADYNVAFGGELDDSDAYPANGCSAAATCLTDAQIRAEVASYITAHSLPRGLTTEYFVILPPNIATCGDGSSSDGCSANSSSANYCAYHTSDQTAANPIIYAVQPYIAGVFGCDDGNHPNGNPSDAALEGGLSHEHIESITDPEVDVPQHGWGDFETGLEVADKCVGEFGAALGTAPDGATYNQLINGHEYWYQEEWSDQGFGCRQRYTPTLPLPTASFTYNGAGGERVDFDASASSASGGVADYEWVFDANTPFPGSTTEVTTPTLSSTFAVSGAGTHGVALTVFAKDGAAAGTAVDLQVPAAIVTVTNPGAQTSVAGVPVSLQVSATASDSGALSYSARGLPDGLSIAASTGKVTGTPSKAGKFNVVVTATDASGPAESASFTWTITDVSVTNPGPQTGTVGNPVSLQINASDTDGGTLSYAATGLPSGLSIDASTGKITGTPTNTGTFNVNVTVDDSTGNANAAAFTWTINSITVFAPGDQTDVTGNAVSLQIDAFDSDGGTLSYAATGLPTGLSIGASTGDITGTPAANGTFNTKVTVSDAKGGSKTAAFTWTVNTVTLTNPGAQTGTLRTATSLQINASDSDGGTLTFAASGLPDGLSIDASTGKITGTPTTTVGRFDVTVTATDPADANGGHSTAFTWTIRPPAADGLLISEFRLTGPGGSGDRYVDIVNPTAASISLSGWEFSVADASSNTTETLSSGSIAPGGHYLVADTSYQQIGDSPADNFLPFGVAADGGVQLIDPSSDVVDAVGFGGARAGYSLGTPLSVPATLPSGQFTWVRNLAGGVPVDSLDNSADFTLVAVNDNDVTHGSPELGAPGPSDSSSPTARNDILQSGLLDPSASAASAPNRIFTSGSPGTLIVNRTITNCSGQPALGACAHAPAGTSPVIVTALRLRITGLTTLDSPGAGSTQAVLKGDSSSGETGLSGANLCSLSTAVHGLSLDAPSVSGAGGLNSTWTATADLPTGGLAPGACINVEFKFDVTQGGRFSFAYNAEDDLKPAAGALTATASTSR